MTFSVIALGRERGEIGVAVATGSTYVADRVPHLEAGVGAVATQGYTLVSYGPEGLRLLRTGLSPVRALRELLRRDPGRDYRQVGIMDVLGRAAAHTGDLTPAWHGHIVEPGCIVLGNLLEGPNVLEAMREALGEAMDSDRPLGEALLTALEAGAEAGGDLRGERSAALIVVLPSRRVVRLRVDDDPQPIAVLRSKWQQKMARQVPGL